MIATSTSDFRLAAQRRLPRFLFDYVDGGAGAETTLRRNEADLEALAVRQRVLRDVADVDLSCTLFSQPLSLPVMLGPVGLTGMYARRGEVQAARAAANRNIPFCLSTVSVCALDEVAAASSRPIWFQLYVIRDRGFMRDLLSRAKAQGVNTLVFTVDMPVPGARRRDAHSGLS
ncbi:MAG TPA: alpha-hydroxy-acid oxidizing protein, partial [Sphingomonas sp.]|nr:alpha-hydroxy-acid oxidizing protein [Sphingomonas sp.]